MQPTTSDLVPLVYAIATMDTKGEELNFVAEQLKSQGLSVATIDVGTLDPPSIEPSVTRDAVAGCNPNTDALKCEDRGQAIEAMSDALQTFLSNEHRSGRVAGVIGLGGTGGTALICPAMAALPIGVPKVMVSTVGGGDVSAFVGGSDIVMFPSIVDVAGLNQVSTKILSNAAHALAGMVSIPSPTTKVRPAIGMTMFGVTTTCATAVRVALEAEGLDPLVFHATGTGGRAMDKLVESKLIRGVLDITTTEVADEVVGGIFPAGPSRFDAIIESEVPYVMSLGAVDMVNFRARSTVPEKFKDRLLHVHNPQITLMRTTPDENREIARWIAGKMNRSTAEVAILIPEKGVSALDAPGQPFFDLEADEALFSELERCIDTTPKRTVRRLPYHINDPEFAKALTGTFRSMWIQSQDGSA
ncbi:MULTISPECIES: Tm-1-like ATP-binding domain-containing protein [Rhodopirellula]|uniref:Tm-1-like ATP-binding domain-containing protein n=1 Tax=Rhodopirellula TaxID=265488 RepID=UPI002579C682|nr:Tm-1-like ATP-binding domain-containing protein [Rhodopirellula sp. UBA1907]|tara:strand:- start:69755 stop:71002 length:1248 start_codon:yes stop_codon:yes gene_type:complete